MGSTSKSLVMGVTSNLRADLMMPFLSSLRGTSYAGRICVFADRTGESDVVKLRSLADDVRVVDSEYPAQTSDWLIRLLSRVRHTPRVRRVYPTLFRLASFSTIKNRRECRRRWLEYRLEGLQTLRYTHYLRYLDEHAADADFILITDMRDVIFQCDPFGARRAGDRGGVGARACFTGFGTV